MQPQAHAFKSAARKALDDETLQAVLSKLKVKFVGKRAAAVALLPEFDALRDEARAIKDHVLMHLDLYLERFEAKVQESGGQVHWCASPQEARETILALCRRVNARTATKGKSMIGEEIGINPFLAENGVEPIETDLGEYIIQLANEPPSHIIGPAVHKTRGQIADLFHEHHRIYGKTRKLSEPAEMVAEAREIMRAKYLAADVGITGANFLIAETGSTVIVTNEGNGDLTQILPKMHIVIASIEKIVPTMEDAMTLLRVLARSATGQEFSTYTTFSTGPKRADDADGPAAFHVVLLDNGRSQLLGGEAQDVLRCIRCGACMNHCPVYQTIGGHAYGWVYPGPIGAALDPALIGLEEAQHLPHASSFCGRCEEVCPMKIPLPKIMRHWRRLGFERGLGSGWQRSGLALWAAFARRPRLYGYAGQLAMTLLGFLGRGRGRFAYLPLASSWTADRDFPAPQGGSFQQQWRKSQRRGTRP